MASANEVFTAPTEGYEPIAAVSAWPGYQPIAPLIDASTILAPDVYRNLNLGYVPHVGDVFRFKSVHHAIYDNFPDGSVIRAIDSFVDLYNPTIVEQSLVVSKVVFKSGGVSHGTRLSPCSSSTLTKRRVGPRTARTAVGHGCGRTLISRPQRGLDGKETCLLPL